MRKASRPARRSSATRTCGSASCRRWSCPRITPRCWSRRRSRSTRRASWSPDAKFWVVEPRISLSGVSGLSTLLSGNYIGFQAGKSSEQPDAVLRARRAADHHGRAGPAVRAEDARRWGSLGVGTPIYYRRLNVGQVTGYALAPDGQSVDVTIFVHAPYDKYVTTETRFWNVSGVNITLGADGINVRTESRRRAARRRCRLRRARVRDGRRPAGPGEIRVHAVSLPRHRDEGAGSRSSAATCSISTSRFADCRWARR